MIDRQIVRIHQQLESLRLLEQQLYSLRDICHAHQTARDCGILCTLAQAAEAQEMEVENMDVQELKTRFAQCVS